MKFAKISQVAHYAPEQVVTNDDLAQIMDTSDEWISSRTGIRKRHISHNESTKSQEFLLKILILSSLLLLRQIH